MSEKWIYGLRKDERIDKEDEISYPFIGIQIPMTNSQYGYFNPSTITFDQIKTNIRNLVLTNKGERYMHPDFGCDIYRILFEPIMIEDIKEKIKINITKQMNFWLPHVIIDDIQINMSTENTDKNIVKISLYFLVGQYDKIPQRLDFTIIAGEK